MSNIDTIELRRAELEEKFVSAWRIFNDTIEAMPNDFSLKTPEDRHSKAAKAVEDARAEQARILGELADNHAEALEYASGVLASGDFSDGLDGLDGAGLTKVMDRAIIRNKGARALAAAQLLDADGDNTAIPRLRANFDEYRVALDYDESPDYVLPAGIRMATVTMPDKMRYGPTSDVAARIEKERRDELDAHYQSVREQRAEREKGLSGPVLPLYTQGRRYG